MNPKQYILTFYFLLLHCSLRYIFLGARLIDAKKLELLQEKKDRPPNLSERLSRGLDRMLSVLGHRLVGTSATNYRWIPFQDRTNVQNTLKPLPGLDVVELISGKGEKILNEIKARCDIEADHSIDVYQANMLKQVKITSRGLTEDQWGKLMSEIENIVRLVEISVFWRYNHYTSCNYH